MGEDIRRNELLSDWLTLLGDLAQTVYQHGGRELLQAALSAQGFIIKLPEIKAEAGKPQPSMWARWRQRRSALQQARRLTTPVDQLHSLYSSPAPSTWRSWCTCPCGWHWPRRWARATPRRRAAAYGWPSSARCWHALRGGSFRGSFAQTRSAAVERIALDERRDDVGFRFIVRARAAAPDQPPP